MPEKQKIVSLLAKNRSIIQVLIGASIYAAYSYFHFSIWWIVGFGSLLGVLWGKVFCRWMCPMGVIMELLTKLSPNDSLKNMYQYHKLGCPIAWISGLLNKVSFYKISLNADSCKNCGLCDKTCYMPSLDKDKYSLYQNLKLSPAEAYSCSKCLQCVAVCPNGSLSFKPEWPAKRTHK